MHPTGSSLYFTFDIFDTILYKSMLTHVLAGQILAHRVKSVGLRRVKSLPVGFNFGSYRVNLSLHIESNIYLGSTFKGLTLSTRSNFGSYLME